MFYDTIGPTWKKNDRNLTNQKFCHRNPGPPSLPLGFSVK